MDWTRAFGIIIQLAVFSVFTSAIIEVIKGVSALGFVGIVKGFINSVVLNKPMSGEAFPVLNFVIAMFCLWAFNITVMSSLFAALSIHETGSEAQQWVAHWIDYFGTASVIYLGSDQLFKKFIDVERQAKNILSEVSGS